MVCIVNVITVACDKYFFLTFFKMKFGKLFVMSCISVVHYMVVAFLVYVIQHRNAKTGLLKLA
jgi:hypothetical protein